MSLSSLALFAASRYSMSVAPWPSAIVGVFIPLGLAGSAAAVPIGTGGGHIT
jgi:hypothetical protein